MKPWDVIVIGGGPAGLSAALAAKRSGSKVMLIEREARLGGILKQCIHDGFGIVRFGERLTGPEYAETFIDEFNSEKIDAMTLTFVKGIEKKEDLFLVSTVNRSGIQIWETRTLILATGCRERTAKQVFIHGSRPAGVMTAGAAQNFINLQGLMPARKCVILGSGDIGLIMARRLTLEGAEVLGVYEAGSSPSGLTRNIHQCLFDYEIPLHLSKTVTRLIGKDRLRAVEICDVDEQRQPVSGTEEIVECDTLILSVGLIPENELAESLGAVLDPATGGPVCDDSLMTSVDGVFCCGNALHVNDLVDYVSESGETAGRAASEYSSRKDGLVLKRGTGLLTLVPQRLRSDTEGKKTLYFRSRKILMDKSLVIRVDGREFFRKKYPFLKPPEMERLELDFSGLTLKPDTKILFEIEEN